jgi:hypothetical protein
MVRFTHATQRAFAEIRGTKSCDLSAMSQEDITMPATTLYRPQCSAGAAGMERGRPEAARHSYTCHQALVVR